MNKRSASAPAMVLLLALLIAFPSAAVASDKAHARSAPAPVGPVLALGLVPSLWQGNDPDPVNIPGPVSVQKTSTRQAIPHHPVTHTAASLVASSPEKDPDRVLSPVEVDRQVTTNLSEDPPEGVRDEFFDTACIEVEKGRDGSFKDLTSPIDKFIRYFTNRGKKRFEVYLSRSGKYGEMMRGILTKYGLPEDLIYLALIESGFSPKAYSHAKAAGPWQFIAETGRRYGLRIDWWADERRDAEKSTHAAASYLKDLYGMFDSWPLATAAYNAGEGKISRAVVRYKSDDFAELIRHRYLKQETKDYVPKMLAAMTIAKEPGKYGFNDIEYEVPLDQRKVIVPGGTDLMETARILEIPYEDIREWNPELRRFCTPPTQKDYELRLSADAASLAEERMEDIQTRAKVTFLQHNVRKKETLHGLAEKYGTSPAILRDLNGLKADSLARVSRLIIPVTGLSGEETVPGKEIAPEKLTMAHLRVEEGRRKGQVRAGSAGKASVKVRKGETLSGIAKKHGISAGELARANDLSGNAKLKAGTRLTLPVGASKNRKTVLRYKVHRGDTLEKIARVYGVKAADLAERNRLKQGAPLRLGAVLVIPRES